jgi:hypothetical protein
MDNFHCSDSPRLGEASSFTKKLTLPINSMIHYHGTPIGGSRVDTIRFLMGRHALVPFTYTDDIGPVADVCQSFVLDNGAFSVWKSGKVLDVEGYKAWVREWCLHPGFDWALIPDVIDGTEDENDAMLMDWHFSRLDKYGVPVWHLHESLERLERLCKNFRIVALGSSGQWSSPGSVTWWERMREVMAAACDKDGRPKAKLHGLRMLDPEVFSRLPLSSADSTNAAVNSGSLSRFGMYKPPTSSQRAEVIAERIESMNSAPVWRHQLIQESLFA